MHTERIQGICYRIDSRRPTTMNTHLQRQPRNSTRNIRSQLLTFVICCFMVISNNALAQHWDPDSLPGQYHADLKTTDSGGGTWGAILRLSVQVQGSMAEFKITSKKGPFYNTDNVLIKSGTHDGSILVSGKITPGSEAAKIRLNLDTVPSYPHRFYASVTNERGQAWVGYVQISKESIALSRPEPSVSTRPSPSSPSRSPSRPVISNNPAEAAVNTPVNIPVAAGKIETGDVVKIQCTASNSNSTQSDPYSSDWTYAGSTVYAPFTFYSTGPQTVFCNTLDSYGTTSSLAQRTILVTLDQDIARSSGIATATSSGTPPSPVIKNPLKAIARTPVSVAVIAGIDPYGRHNELVKISCAAKDSNRTDNAPYISPKLNPGEASDAMFIFSSEGSKEIYCTAYNRQGAASSSTKQKITIKSDNRSPLHPELSDYPYNTITGKATYISVTAGNDPDGGQVRVQCSVKDSNITGNAPYLSKWVAPRGKVSAGLTFYSTGVQKISCVTLDRKGAKSKAAVRKINVSRPAPFPISRPTFPATSEPSDNCSCNSKTNERPAFNPNQFQAQAPAPASTSSTCNVCNKNKAAATPRQNKIKFTSPYMPSQNKYKAYQPKLQMTTPQLRGDVVYNSNGSPVQNGEIKVWDPISGRAQTATTDFNGQFSLDLANRTYLIQATKGEFTSSITELSIKGSIPAVINLRIMDKQDRQGSTMMRQWSTPLKPKATPSRKNSIWQFN